MAEDLAMQRVEKPLFSNPYEATARVVWNEVFKRKAPPSAR
ncbi:MAG: hypothetical protein WBD63_10005 [Phycisphaerae bacterium]|nr:hypothetical protein [Phycisphaerae bacterium]